MTLSLTVLLATAFLAAPARAQDDGAMLFPPVADILGQSQPLLPSGETADLRDALAERPSLKHELRALSSASAARQR
ncbi:MAG: hypothetical protein KGL53_03075, partial [Elusimicrobia bacterium]|nr:hypothetical protein [Elusimicrobiota bacterium]